MPLALAIDANAALQSLGATVTLDTFPGLGHGVDSRVLHRIAERLHADSPSDSAV